MALSGSVARICPLKFVSKVYDIEVAKIIIIVTRYLSANLDLVDSVVLAPLL